MYDASDGSNHLILYLSENEAVNSDQTDACDHGCIHHRTLLASIRYDCLNFIAVVIYAHRYRLTDIHTMYHKRHMGYVLILLLLFFCSLLLLYTSDFHCGMLGTAKITTICLTDYEWCLYNNIPILTFFSILAVFQIELFIWYLLFCFGWTFNLTKLLQTTFFSLRLFSVGLRVNWMNEQKTKKSARGKRERERRFAEQWGAYMYCSVHYVLK